MSQIIALREGGIVPVMEWTHQDDARASSKAWFRRLCIDRVRRALDSDLAATEVFLCLMGDELVARRDQEALCRLLKEIADNCWGSRLFVVTSKPPWASTKARARKRPKSPTTATTS